MYAHRVKESFRNTPCCGPPQGSTRKNLANLETARQWESQLTPPFRHCWNRDQRAEAGASSSQGGRELDQRRSAHACARNRSGRRLSAGLVDAEDHVGYLQGLPALVSGLPSLSLAGHRRPSGKARFEIDRTGERLPRRQKSPY